MSLVPILAQLARELDTDCRGQDDWDHVMDDDFGFGVNPVDIFRPRMMSPFHRRSALAPYLLGRRHRYHRDRSDAAGTAAMPTVTKEGFQVCMDVSQFKPSELSVKTVDNVVVVEGKHEEREDDHGLIQRHFVRKYTLPKDYEAGDVQSTISSDGILTVKAPPPVNKAIQNERVVQIQQTGTAHLNVKRSDHSQANKQNGSPSNEKIETVH